MSRLLFLADLRLVHPITGWHLATTPPPPSVLHAGILASRFRVKQCQSSSVPHERVPAIRSCLLYAGRVWSFSAVHQHQEPPGIVPHLEGEEMRPTALSFWTKCLSHFHFSILTALQTEVSLVSIDRRGSTSIRLAPDIGTLSAGFTPRRMPFFDACRFPLTSLSKCSPVDNTFVRERAHLPLE